MYYPTTGEMREVLDFFLWVKELPYERKIIIAGNHDLTFDKTYEGDHGKSKTDGSEVRDAFKQVAASLYLPRIFPTRYFCLRELRRAHF